MRLAFKVLSPYESVFQTLSRSWNFIKIFKNSLKWRALGRPENKPLQTYTKANLFVIVVHAHFVLLAYPYTDTRSRHLIARHIVYSVQMFLSFTLFEHTAKIKFGNFFDEKKKTNNCNEIKTIKYIHSIYLMTFCVWISFLSLPTG